jgi:hypothetical protein
VAMSIPIWSGRSVSWEAIKARYDIGKLLGKGTFAHVYKVHLDNDEHSDILGHRKEFK